MWKRTSKRKEAVTTRQLLSSIKINLTQVYKDLRPAVQNHFASEQYTKKGAGRKHKQGKARYTPRELERNALKNVHP